MNEEDIKTIFVKDEIYTEKGFMSTAFDYNDFLKYWLAENLEHNVLMKIEGSTAKNVQAVSEIPEEAEALFSNNKDFKIISIREIDNPIGNDKEMVEIILKER